MIRQLLVSVLFWASFADSFVVVPSRCSSILNRRQTTISRRMADSSSSSFQDDETLLSSTSTIMGDQDDCLVSPDSQAIHSALQSRVKDLQEGIGKRYRCKTQQGFLNIHKEPGDPYDTNNIVGVLQEGQVVTSTAPQRGAWVKHDGGGWSISVYGGFIWLEPLE